MRKKKGENKKNLVVNEGKERRNYVSWSLHKIYF